MSFPFEITADNVVVKRVKNTETKTGKLYIPTSAATDENQCTVVAVGIKVSDKAIEAGATVLVEKYDGRKVQVDGIDYIVLAEEDILGVKPKEG